MLGKSILVAQQGYRFDIFSVTPCCQRVNFYATPFQCVIIFDFFSPDISLSRSCECLLIGCFYYAGGASSCSLMFLLILSLVSEAVTSHCSAVPVTANFTVGLRAWRAMCFPQYICSHQLLLSSTQPTASPQSLSVFFFFFLFHKGLRLTS